MNLSVCLIARNEEKNIERCLQALSGYGFELVVVDTGSADRTREIAEQFTDKVYTFAWRDDFAAAKNYAISKAGGDLVLVTDCDEFLEPLSKADLEELESLLRQNPGAVGRVRRRNLFTRDGLRQENREWINRIFDRREFQYEGRIHEQVTGILKEDYATYLTPLVFLHTGYDLQPKERKQKTQRNLLLLERELSEAMEELVDLQKEDANAGSSKEERLRQISVRQEQIPYLLYQLGKSHYMAKDYAQSCVYFAKALGYDLNPKLEYVIDMVETYGYALINSGRAQEALSFENIYAEFGNSADFQFLMGLIYMRNARFEAAIKEFEKALRHSDCRSAGVNSYAANYNLGVIYECLGHLDQAKEYYQKCKDYAPAGKRLQEIRSDIP